MTPRRLPARPAIEENESFVSFACRLASMNDVAVQAVLGNSGLPPKRRIRPEMIERVADLSGIDHSRLVDSTMLGCSGAALHTTSPWRLRTTVWECRWCASRGITDRDRGLAIAFACVRCGTLLEAEGFGQHDKPTALDPSVIDLQRELSAAFHESATRPSVVERLDRLAEGANVLGRALAKSPKLDAKLWPAIEALPDCEKPSDRWARGALGLPEYPSLFAEVLTTGWDAAGSPHMHHLIQVGLGGPRKLRAPQSLPCTEFDFFNLRPDLQAMQVSNPVPVIEIGVRIRELVRVHGLRSVHVPNEIRYHDDPMILDQSTWRWRRDTCIALRHWLLRLEGDVPDPEWQGRGYFDSAVDIKDLPRPSQIQLVVSNAATFANQVLELATYLVGAGLTEQRDFRTRLPSVLVDQVVPATARRPETPDLAGIWMWLDEVVGTDAHTSVPAYSVADLARFHKELGPEGRLSLREYRTQHAMKDRELVDSTKVGHAQACDETA